VLKAVGSHRYAADASTEIMCCAYAVDDGLVRLWTPGNPVPPEFIEAANNPASNFCLTIDRSSDYSVEKMRLRSRFRRLATAFCPNGLGS
jgi:hypothetical protein